MSYYKYHRKTERVFIKWSILVSLTLFELFLTSLFCIITFLFLNFFYITHFNSTIIDLKKSRIYKSSMILYVSYGCLSLRSTLIWPPAKQGWPLRGLAASDRQPYIIYTVIVVNPFKTVKDF
jgi:hypothetical protein